MSASKSTAITVFADIRVAGDINNGIGHVTFTPPYRKADGNLVDARCSFKAYCNKPTKSNNGKNSSNLFNFVVWGGYAYVCAKACSPGRLFTCTCTPESYYSAAFDKTTQKPLLYANGEQAVHLNVAFKMDPSTISFGNESPKQVELEIQNGIRPQQWNVLTHPDYTAWKDIYASRIAFEYDGQADSYGFAKVVKPANVQILTKAMYKEAKRQRSAYNTQNPAPVNTQTPAQTPFNQNQAPAQTPFNQNQAPAVNNGGFATTAPVQTNAPAFNNTPVPPNTPAFNNAPVQPNTPVYNAPVQPNAPVYNAPANVPATTRLF